MQERQAEALLEDVDPTYSYVEANEPAVWDLVFLGLEAVNCRFANHCETQRACDV